MNANAFWNVFLTTGAPEAYLLYANARRMEESNVSECAGSGSESYRL